jgi:hypothetical protein
MVITTNPRLSKWAAVFGDARMTTKLNRPGFTGGWFVQ